MEERRYDERLDHDAPAARSDASRPRERLAALVEWLWAEHARPRSPCGACCRRVAPRRDGRARPARSSSWTPSPSRSRDGSPTTSRSSTGDPAGLTRVIRGQVFALVIEHMALGAVSRRGGTAAGRGAGRHRLPVGAVSLVDRGAARGNLAPGQRHSGPRWPMPCRRSIMAVSSHSLEEQGHVLRSRCSDALAGTVRRCAPPDGRGPARARTRPSGSSSGTGAPSGRRRRRSAPSGCGRPRRPAADPVVRPASSGWPAPTSPATSTSTATSSTCSTALKRARPAARPRVGRAGLGGRGPRRQARRGARSAAGHRRPRRPVQRGRCATPRRVTRRAISHHYDVGNDFYEIVLGSGDDLLVRPLRSARSHPGRGAGGQARAGVPQARAARAPAPACSTSAAAGARWPCTRPPTTARRWSASPSAPSRPTGPGSASPQAGLAGPRRDPAPGLPGPRRRALRRHLVDRDVRARRRAPHRRVLRAAAPSCSAPPAGCSTTPSRASAARASSAAPSPGATCSPTASCSTSAEVVARHGGAGFEVRDVESLREHYARTLRELGREPRGRLGPGRRAWSARRRARVWRLYMAGSAVGFDDGGVSIHQVLGVAPDRPWAQRHAAHPGRLVDGSTTLPA